MTIFGPDISSYEAGLALSQLAQASFVIAKTTEGTFYTDADYQGWRIQCGQLGKPFVWYHFLSGEDAAAQAAHTKANVGDVALPGMLDFEPAGSFKPTMAQAIAYADAARAAGLRLKLVYLPHWYWEQLGSPSLAPLATRGLQLVSSSYPGGTGTPAGLYPGDGAAGWTGYGGMAPLLYQFTNQASDGGKNEDYNAFRGTVAQLQAALGAGTSTQGADVQLTDQIAIPPAAQAAFPDFGFIGTPDVQAVLAWTAARASHTVNQTGRIETKLDQLLSRPAPTADQIGAAVASHLSGGGGASATDIAAAVEHLFAQKLSA